MSKGTYTIENVGPQKVRLSARPTEERDRVADVMQEEKVGHIIFYNKDERPMKAVLFGWPTTSRRWSRRWSTAEIWWRSQ